MVDIIIFNFNLPDAYKDEQDYMWEVKMSSTPKVDLYTEFNTEIIISVAITSRLGIFMIYFNSTTVDKAL